MREKGPQSFDGAASLAQPASLPVNLSKNSPQSLKAVLTKYYTSLLYKMTNQLPGKKTAFEKFSMIVQLMTDERELTNVLDLYEIKLTNQGDIEDSIKEENSPFPIFTEVNKAYYISVLDKQWA